MPSPKSATATATSSTGSTSNVLKRFAFAFILVLVPLLPGSFIQVTVITNLSGKQGSVYRPGGLYLRLLVCCFRVACACRGRAASIHQIAEKAHSRKPSCRFLGFSETGLPVYGVLGNPASGMRCSRNLSTLTDIEEQRSYHPPALLGLVSSENLQCLG